MNSGFDNQSIKSAHFRSPNEFTALFFSLGLVLALGFAFALINLYVLAFLIASALIFFRLQQARLTGESIRVHENQFGEIFETFRDFALSLGIQKAALYIRQDPTLNAYTLGLTKCSVVLNSALVEQLTKDELDFVIAHELGHYKASHTKISTLILPLGSNNPYSSFIFGFWNRKAEYTADRCALALTKNIDTAITALIKLAIGGKLFQKLDTKGFIAQIKKAQTSDMNWGELAASHPLILNRIKGLSFFWKESFQTV